MLLDCAIIGGGPAGLNAALVLGRARRTVMLFDNSKPRNAVTQHSHGFITRDGIKPKEFRALAHEDISKYPSVEIKMSKVVGVKMERGVFALVTARGDVYHARTILIATGLKENLPAIKGLQDCYGKSLFSCPYCDGWELRDKPLVVISEAPQADHLARLVHNWSRDLIVCTNGSKKMDAQQRKGLSMKGIQVYDEIINRLSSDKGMLKTIVFADGSTIERSGGFISPQWSHAVNFSEALGCSLNNNGGIATDSFGRTSVRGVYAAGDASIIAPSQVIVAAGEGSKAAIGVNTDLTFDY